jgi:hypothetical protein
MVKRIVEAELAPKQQDLLPQVGDAQGGEDHARRWRLVEGIEVDAGCAASE